jgi:hypothetical protein
MTEETKAYQILVEMYGIIERNTRKLSRDCFNQLVRFLADCTRVQPLPDEDKPVANQLMALAEPFTKAYYQSPQDYLAQLFSEKECSNDQLGQIMTPRFIAEYMTREVLSDAIEDSKADKRMIRVLDPAVGTGIFLVEAARLFPQPNLVFYGVELDLDLYRAALVNMRFAAFGRPYLILRANTLIVDVQADSLNWRFANQWNPPAWETAMTMESGQTWATWCEAHGTKTTKAHIPTQSKEKLEARDDNPLQPRLF